MLINIINCLVVCKWGNKEVLKVNLGGFIFFEDII